MYCDSTIDLLEKFLQKLTENAKEVPEVVMITGDIVGHNLGDKWNADGLFN